MKIEIDERSGFCFGVVNAIAQADRELDENEILYCLGQIVHNSEEEQRLIKKGLRTINHDQLKEFGGKRVMIRAHGEPPQTYRLAFNKGIKLIDASCPVVLKLQAKVKRGYEAMQKVGGQIVIFGKRGHAEVIALKGQTDGTAYLVESINDMDLLDFTKPIQIFSQTTMNPIEYSAIVDEIRSRIVSTGGNPNDSFTAHSTICNQVMNRKQELIEFASRFHYIVFVSGKSSSNGKMLYEVCLSQNQKSFFVSTPDELRREWFEDADSVGICGATSTPLWLMEQVASKLRELLPH